MLSCITNEDSPEMPILKQVRIYKQKNLLVSAALELIKFKRFISHNTYSKLDYEKVAYPVLFAMQFKDNQSL